jgi:hypothetical protein
MNARMPTRDWSITKSGGITPRVVLDPYLCLAQDASEFCEARQVSLDAALVLDDVGVGEELRGADQDAGNLVDAVAVVLEFALADEVVEDPRRGFPGNEFLAREAAGPYLSTGARLISRAKGVLVHLSLIVELLWKSNGVLSMKPSWVRICGESEVSCRVILLT